MAMNLQTIYPRAFEWDYCKFDIIATVRRTAVCYSLTYIINTDKWQGMGKYVNSKQNYENDHLSINLSHDKHVSVDQKDAPD